MVFVILIGDKIIIFVFYLFVKIMVVLNVVFIKSNLWSLCVKYGRERSKK